MDELHTVTRSVDSCETSEKMNIWEYQMRITNIYDNYLKIYNFR